MWSEKRPSFSLLLLAQLVVANRNVIIEFILFVWHHLTLPISGICALIFQTWYLIWSIKIHNLIVQWLVSLTAGHIRNLWVVLAGPQQMSCTHAVRTTRFLSGTCWPMRPAGLSNCQRTFTPLTYTGSPKLLVARNRPRLRSLLSPALMASLFILKNKCPLGYCVLFLSSLIDSVCQFWLTSC